MDPVRTIQGLYQREGRVPSIRQLVKAGVKKAGIYENYGGLRGLCKAAGVPLPEERFERVGAAMKSPRGPPQPGGPVESIYKPLPQPYVQPPPQQQPQAVPQPPPAPPIVIKVETGAKEALTKVDIKEMIEETKAPAPPKEASIEERVREVFGADVQERKKQDERFKPIREGQVKLDRRMDEVFAKLERQEYPWQKPEAQAQPEASPLATPKPQPYQPSMSADDLIREAEEIAREIARKKVLAIKKD